MPEPEPLDETEGALEELQQALDRGDCDHEQMFAAYANLPEPRPAYLSSRLRVALLRQLGEAEGDPQLVLYHYMTVFNEVLEYGGRPTPGDWNQAIHLSGKVARRTDASHLNMTMNLWRDMENVYSITASSMTFNVLYDAATKAGNLVLAEMLQKEMEHRQLPLDRYFRTSRIRFEQAKGSADGVRQAYREFVDAGEIVDTVVISAVITALIATGEPVTAENVFIRANRLHNEKPTLSEPPKTLVEEREWSRLLRGATSLNDKSKAEIAATAPLAPGRNAYRALIQHHAAMGNADRVMQLLAIMSEYGFFMTRSVFDHIFSGFARHGRAPLSAWSSRFLNVASQRFMQAVKDEHNPLILVFALVQKYVRAYATCASLEEAREALQALLETRRWTPTEDELAKLHELIDFYEDES